MHGVVKFLTSCSFWWRKRVNLCASLALRQLSTFLALHLDATFALSLSSASFSAFNLLNRLACLLCQ